MMREGMEAIRPASRPHEFDAAAIGALAHLYRGEVYRSTIWRTRPGQYDKLGGGHTWHRSLGNILQPGCLTAAAPPRGYSLHRLLDFRGAALPLFQRLARAGSLDRAKFLCPYAARGKPQARYSLAPRFSPTITASRAIISALPAPSGGGCAAITFGSSAFRPLAYYGKIAIHPGPVSSLSELVQRASLGPIPGELMLLAGILFSGGWIA